MRMLRFSRLASASAVLAFSAATVVLSSVSQSHAQQSFGFSYSTSSSFSSSEGQPSKEPMSPGEEPSSSYPTTNRNGFRNGKSKSISNVNGHIVEKSSEDRDGCVVSTTRVLNGKQDVFIEESDELGVRVTIKENIRGKEKKSEYQAESRKALRKKHPAAFDWVRRYASEPSASKANTHRGNNGGTGNAQASGFANGGFGGFSAAGGNAAGAGNADGGGLTGPDAHLMLKQSIEQMIQQTDDPNLKQQLRGVLEQIQNRAAQANG